FLTSMLIDLSARTTLVSALYQSQSEAQTSNDDHAAIVAALADGDNALAERLMLEHIDTLAGRLDETRAGSGSARDRLRSALAPDAPATRPRSTSKNAAGAGAK
ncbi:MAG: FCD domain-containing protein, partial [Alicycliphilus sp.]